MAPFSQLAYDHTAILGPGDGSVPTERVAAITVPALVMYGTASPPFMRDTAELLCKWLPGGELRPLDGQDHNVNAGVVSPILVEFFRS